MKTAHEVQQGAGAMDALGTTNRCKVSRSLRRKRMRTATLAVIGSATVAAGLMVPLPGAGGQALAATSRSSSDANSCPWVTSGAPIATRVRMLLDQMSIAQLDNMVHGDGETSGYVGQVAGIPSLCIPPLNLEDGPQGVGDAMTGVTQLPAAVSAAATWSPSLAQSYGNVIGSEQAGKGANVDLGPTVNIVRDPRWGRAFETYGEDPYLSGQIAAADIRGIQGQGVMAQVKHWDVYNQETNRNTPADNAVVSQRTMQEIYMPQFKAAIQQGGAASVMCSYSWINGQAACENSYINSVLRNQFGFNGFITSDWGATHSTVASANAGLNMEMPDAAFFGTPLVQAVQSGQVSLTTLRSMVSPILTEMFRFGLFNKPATGSPTAVVTNPAHAAVARSVAAQSSVLLQNNDSTLPLSPGRPSSVAVIGSDASTDVMSSGQGSASVVAPYVVTPLQGIQSRAGSGTAVTYAQGDAPTTTDLPAVPASAFPGGLSAQYFNNTTLSGTPAATATVSQVSFSWPAGSPAPGVNPTGWSAKFTGQIEAPTSGTYNFTLNSSYLEGYFENGARLYVNGQLVIDNWAGTHSGPASGSVVLTAGTPVSIEIDFAQTGITTYGTSFNLNLGWINASSLLNQAVAVAKASKVALVFVGNEEGEGSDLANIDLSATDNTLITAVAAANPNTVVVLNTGSAVTMPWLNQVKSVIEAWYPGQEDGNAIADVLYGSVDPSGHLPVTFPERLADVPASTPQQWPGVNGEVDYSEGLLVGYRWYSATGIEPLFPFGYGLSYTHFALSDLHLIRLGNDGHGGDRWRGQPGHGSVIATVRITNTGSRAGSDTVQAYVRDPAYLAEPPEQLKGFDTTSLRPGQTKTVRIGLDSSSFAYYNTAQSEWQIAPGKYQVMVGDSSANLPLRAPVDVSPRR